MSNRFTDVLEDLIFTDEELSYMPLQEVLLQLDEAVRQITSDPRILHRDHYDADDLIRSMTDPNVPPKHLKEFREYCQYLTTLKLTYCEALDKAEAWWNSRS